VLDLKPKRERKQSGKITRWTEAEEAQLSCLVDEFGATGHWTEARPTSHAPRPTPHAPRPTLHLINL